LLDAPDPAALRWLPSLERPTGFNEIPERPGIIYTDGGAGFTCDDVLANKVLWRTL